MIKYKVNMNELAGVIGTIQGAAKVLEDRDYIDAVLRHAHGRAADRFDQDASAYALATGTINHMFEWGTAGINRGRTTRRMNPDSQEAKLWRHHLTGMNGDLQASFNFQPSVVPIPKPTVVRTGVPRTVLNRLTGGPYVFTGKAAIMEAGLTVTIRPRGDNMLFVPFGNESAKDPSARAHGRNYIFTKGPINTVPGKTVAGNFSKFWIAWWSTEGDHIVGDYTQRKIDRKLDTLVDSIGRRIGQRPIRMTAKSFSMNVEKARKLAEREMYTDAARDNIGRI